MSIYKHINKLNNNKWFYTILFLLYINVNYSQDSIYKEFFFNSGEISSKGYLINNLPGGKWVSFYSNSKIKSHLHHLHLGPINQNKPITNRYVHLAAMNNHLLTQVYKFYSAHHTYYSPILLK